MATDVASCVPAGGEKEAQEGAGLQRTRAAAQLAK
jgi:hypothetical protein